MERELLGKAIKIATIAHDGQVDKAGFPYILHPLRVMMGVKTLRRKILGVLHDVIEDTYVTEEMLLAEGFPQGIVEDVALLSRPEGMPYEDYLLQVKQREDVRIVKLGDMKDNANLLRYHELESKHLKMVKKYHKGIKLLQLGLDERLEI